MKSKKYRSSRLSSFKGKQQIEFEENPYNIILYGRFLNFLSKQKFQKLKTAMQNYIGRNSPINYRPQFDFRQQWQTIKKTIQVNTTDFLNERNFLTQSIAVIILLGFSSLIWFISFQRIFQVEDYELTKGFYSLGIIITSIYLVLKLLLSLQKIYRSISKFQILTLYLTDIILVIYFVIQLVILQNIGHKYQFIMFITDIFYIITSYKRCSQIYKSFKMKVITSTYKDIFKMFDLFATSLIVAHIFALILFTFSKIGNFDKNWLIKANIQDQNPKIQYIYAMYFACTTMFTVGYGDMTPANVIQIFAVLCIQIFGIAIFAYVLNQIGHTLSSIRKQQQNLQKDLSSLSKIAKYYDLDTQLTRKARNFIINNQTSIQDLLPQEQNQLLMKLNDDLRTQINQQNSFRIIKSSLFFICHWSKKMQFELAKRLTKKIFTPNQKLLQIPGKQCIYIIKKGKVQIYTDKQSGLKRYFKRLLKTIQSNEHLDVSHNVYGYVATICSHPIKLKAMAKDFTVVYYLQKNEFYQSLMDTQSDIEYYHQIKTRLDLQKDPQAYEAPVILNIRQHYRPSIVYVIKKHKKNKKVNKRINYLRDQNRQEKRRLRLQFYNNMEELQQNAIFTYKTYQKQKPYHPNKNSAPKFQVMKSSSQMKSILIHQQKQNDSNITKNNTIIGELKNKLQFPQLLQSCKQYVNYFKRFNLTDVLLKLDFTSTSKYQRVQDESTQNKQIVISQVNQMKNQIEEIQPRKKTRKLKNTLNLNFSKLI